mmetsp:Transcript_11223/g.23789  ORF Transcript_11223/g.23789 Transcript_11223/m.23789 type:complete len:232 (-) Transcript_11223:1048-1743(-)
MMVHPSLNCGVLSSTVVMSRYFELGDPSCDSVCVPCAMPCHAMPCLVFVSFQQQRNTFSLCQQVQNLFVVRPVDIVLDAMVCLVRISVPVEHHLLGFVVAVILADGFLFAGCVRCLDVFLFPLVFLVGTRIIAGGNGFGVFCGCFVLDFVDFVFIVLVLVDFFLVVVFVFVVIIVSPATKDTKEPATLFLFYLFAVFRIRWCVFLRLLLLLFLAFHGILQKIGLFQAFGGG